MPVPEVLQPVINPVINAGKTAIATLQPYVDKGLSYVPVVTGYIKGAHSQVKQQCAKHPIIAGMAFAVTSFVFAGGFLGSNAFISSLIKNRSLIVFFTTVTVIVGFSLAILVGGSLLGISLPVVVLIAALVFIATAFLILLLSFRKGRKDIFVESCSTTEKTLAKRIDYYKAEKQKLEAIPNRNDEQNNKLQSYTDSIKSFEDVRDKLKTEIKERQQFLFNKKHPKKEEIKLEVGGENGVNNNNNSNNNSNINNNIVNIGDLSGGNNNNNNLITNNNNLITNNNNENSIIDNNNNENIIDKNIVIDNNENINNENNNLNVKKENEEVPVINNNDENVNNNNNNNIIIDNNENINLNVKNEDEKVPVINNNENNNNNNN